MRVRCVERWSSTDPLIAAHLDEIDDWRIPWEAVIRRLPNDRMHASYRLQVKDGNIVPRTEDFRIYLVEEIVRPIDMAFAVTATDPEYVASICKMLDHVMVGDKIVVLHEDDEGGRTMIHANPEFVDVEIF